MNDMLNLTRSIEQSAKKYVQPLLGSIDYIYLLPFDYSTHPEERGRQLCAHHERTGQTTAPRQYRHISPKVEEIVSIWPRKLGWNIFLRVLYVALPDKE